METFRGFKVEQDSALQASTRKGPRQALTDRSSRGRNEENEIPPLPLSPSQSPSPRRRTMATGKMPMSMKGNAFIQVK